MTTQDAMPVSGPAATPDSAPADDDALVVDNGLVVDIDKLGA
jgi:hypothetical protein